MEKAQELPSVHGDGYKIQDLGVGCCFGIFIKISELSAPRLSINSRSLSSNGYAKPKRDFNQSINDTNDKIFILIFTLIACYYNFSIKISSM